MGEFFKWEYVGYYFPKVLSALPTTLLIVLVATIMGIILGMLIVFIRLEKIPILNLLSRIFVSFTRGTPIFIQMFIVFYGFPVLLESFGIATNSWPKINYIYITYALNTAAFFSETFRGAILSVPASQTEAAAAVGLTRVQTYRRIILPQAVRIALPNVGTLIVSLLQDTSLAFSLGIIDVIGKVKALSALTYRSIEGYFVAAIIFVVLSIVLEQLFAFLERKFSYQYKPKRESQKAQRTSRAVIQNLEESRGLGKRAFIDYQE